MIVADDEQVALERVMEKLQQAGFRIDTTKKVIRRGREKVYFISLENMKRMLFFIHDLLYKDELK